MKISEIEKLIEEHGTRNVKIAADGTVTARPSFFGDVGAFHARFGLPHAGNTAPDALDQDVTNFRVRFMLEELAEFCDAHERLYLGEFLRDVCKDDTLFAIPLGCPGVDLEKAADALADLVYVALGTAHLMGLPFDEVWGEVQRANMAKVRATGADDARSKRKHSLDVVKPDGWTAPDHKPAIDAAIRKAGAL